MSNDFERRISELGAKKQEVSFMLDVASKRGQMRRSTALELDAISARVASRQRVRLSNDNRVASERNRRMLADLNAVSARIESALQPTAASSELTAASVAVYAASASLGPGEVEAKQARLSELEAESAVVATLAAQREARALRNLQVDAELSAKLVDMADAKRQAAERLAQLEARRAANAQRDAELVKAIERRTSDAEQLQRAAKEVAEQNKTVFETRRETTPSLPPGEEPSVETHREPLRGPFDDDPPEPGEDEKDHVKVSAQEQSGEKEVRAPFRQERTPSGTQNRALDEDADDNNNDDDSDLDITTQTATSLVLGSSRRGSLNLDISKLASTMSASPIDDDDDDDGSDDEFGE